ASRRSGAWPCEPNQSLLHLHRWVHLLRRYVQGSVAGNQVWLRATSFRTRFERSSSSLQAFVIYHDNKAFRDGRKSREPVNGLSRPFLAFGTEIDQSPGPRLATAGGQRTRFPWPLGRWWAKQGSNL